MTATCPDCDQIAQARAEHDQEFLGWVLAGVSFIAATWRVTRARRQLQQLAAAQLAAAQLVDEPLAEVPPTAADETLAEPAAVEASS